MTDETRPDDKGTQPAQAPDAAATATQPPESSAEGAPAEGAAAEGTPAERAPVEGAPVEGAPAEGASAEGAPAEGAAAGGNGKEQAKKLKQDVVIKDAGPCKKHIQVTIARESLDDRLEVKYKELMKGEAAAIIPGFRPGKAPKALIVRRYQKDVSEQVKSEVLLASLEQLAEDHDLAPLAPPNIDPKKIEVPKDGPLVYEFDVEVRPEFDLPDYKGLQLKRPVKEFTDEDVAREQRRVLAPFAQAVPKEQGAVEPSDLIVADVTIRDGDRTVNTLKETIFRVDPQLAFKDGVADRFGQQIAGARAGDSRTVDITVSQASADPALRGKTVQATFAVKDVKTLRMPEFTHEFLRKFGVQTPEQFRELILTLLKRRLARTQRQAAREQIIHQLAGHSQWDLPEDLLLRQARRALSRRVMEMRSEGVPEEEIRGRARLLEQDVFRSTALSLKEHFVLQKIAEAEKIDVDEDDIEDEIERLAAQYDESPRRLRARLEKEDMLEALAAELIEHKVLDLILDNAQFEDVLLGREEQAPVGMVEAQTVPGEMKDMTTPPPAAEPGGETKDMTTPPPAADSAAEGQG